MNSVDELKEILKYLEEADENLSVAYDSTEEDNCFLVVNVKRTEFSVDRCYLFQNEDGNIDIQEIPSIDDVSELFTKYHIPELEYKYVKEYCIELTNKLLKLLENVV